MVHALLHEVDSSEEQAVSKELGIELEPAGNV
jgi:hypothetical protein